MSLTLFHQNIFIRENNKKRLEKILQNGNNNFSIWWICGWSMFPFLLLSCFPYFLQWIYYFFFFLKIFLMWNIFKVFTEFVTISLLFYVLVFWPRGMWDLSSLTRDRTCTPCIGRRSLNHWNAREVPLLLK